MAGIECLPPRFPEPGTGFEHSSAWVCSMHTSPSHSADLLFPPSLFKENTPRNLAGFAYMPDSLCNVLLQAAMLWTVTWSATVSCYVAYCLIPL